MRFRSRLIVDLNLLGENVHALREQCPSNEILFMVKADAYGHGLLPTVRFARTDLGIKEFGLASLGEALVLRDELKGLEFETYVFSDVQLHLRDCAEIYLNRRIIPVISNLESLEFFLKEKEFANFPLCLKVNTGMNRLGIDELDFEKMIALIKNSGRKSIFHLITHFANASMSMQTNKRNISQREKFKEIKSLIRASGIDIERSSIGNSGAIEQKVGLDETHIRPGLMLYGPTSLLPQYREQSWWRGKLISKLETNIIKTFPVKKGTPIGYGSTPCHDDGIVAIIALGYGDGFSTFYQGANLWHNGIKGKVVGRVNMDMAQVFFPMSAENYVRQGDLFTVWDHDSVQFDEFCHQVKIIPYEVFLNLTARIPRCHFT